MDEILQEFLSETAETMEEIGGEIVAWEADPSDRERLDTIFRFVHTVKGSCGFLDLPRIGALSHAAEDALDTVRQGKREPTTALVSSVLAIIDRIIDLTEAVGASGSEPGGNDRDLIDGLSGPGLDDAPAAIEQPLSAEPAMVKEDNAAPYQGGQSWRTIRVPLKLLDSIMNGVSDMVLARNEVARAMRSEGEAANLSTAFERLSTSVADMRNSVSQMRMQRIEKLFAPLPRIVRDLSQDLGKKVSVTIEGGEVELDREMIESIRDPLTHIIRNAIDHGIEDPSDREAAGKDPTGQLFIGARQSGNQILISVRDDGKGISVDGLVTKAIAANVVTSAEAKTFSAARKLALIFSAGLSTASEVTAISGRGVGMDVVRSNIERIGGLVDLDNREGKGLTITLRVPLTLTIISGLTVSAGDQLFAIPRASVSEIILQQSEAVRIDRAGGADIAIVRGERLSLVYLEDSLGLAHTDKCEHDRSIIITRGTGGSSYALSVADVFDHEELVIKPAAPAIMATGIYAGTTLPDNGQPMLLLDASGIAEKAGLSLAASDQARLKETAEDAAEAHGVQVLLFREFDGTVRAVSMEVIDRVDDVSVATISYSAGRLRALIGEHMIPVYDCDIPSDIQRAKLLRLSDGDTEMGYAIRDVIDVTTLNGAIEPALETGLIAGVSLVDGSPVELIDSFVVFASLSRARKAGDRPTCRLTEPEDHWSRQFLAPLVEAAGYHVVFGDAETDADIVIATEDCPNLQADNDNVLRLRKSEQAKGKTDRSIYRYDRDAILHELNRISQGA